jgi:hypothetical protein
MRNQIAYSLRMEYTYYKYLIHTIRIWKTNFAHRDILSLLW